MRLWLVYTQPLHEPAVLLWSKRLCFAFLSWPLETSGLKALVQQHESVSFPVQRLDSIPASATEEKECIGEWIQVELLLYNGSQSVYTTTQVSVATCDIYPVCSGEVRQHDCKIRSTVSTVAASAPL